MRLVRRRFSDISRSAMQSGNSYCHKQPKNKRANCVQGHEGLLCGSCAPGYGPIGLDCSQCMAKGVIVFLMLLNVVWFCFIASVSMRGNMIGESPEHSRRLRRLATCNSMTPSLAELYIIGDVPTPEARSQVDRTHHPEPGTTEYESAKRNLAERVKVKQC